MVNIITPESLRRDTDVPSVEEMWNAIWNLYSTYQAVHGQPPKYLYLNQSVWEEYVGPAMFADIAALGMKVIFDPELVPNRVDMHHHYIPPKDLATWQRSFSDQEGEEQGLLSIE
jgi:hypothetical protein